MADLQTALELGLLPAGVYDFLPVFGHGELPIILAACFDSAVKPNRYNSAGRSGGYMGAAAVLGRFLGKAHDKLWHMTSSGELYVAQSRIAELGAHEVSIGVDGECHPILTCSRLTSQRSGLCDEFGLTGYVCSHGQPLLGMFLAMPAPERFLYYDLALQELLLEARVNVMYLDTGCSYSRHLQLHSPEAAAPGHTTVGETCEQLWAQLKPLTSITRYMAKPNYQDCIDDFLGFVAAARLEEFVPFMVGQRKSLVRKLEECRNRYLDLVVTAGQQGLTEMQLLHAALDREGRSLHARGLDSARLQKLAEKLGVLMTKLDIQEPLQPSSSEGLSAWTDSKVTELFQGKYPWRHEAADDSGAAAAVLAERFRDACAEEARTIEELVMQRFERERTQQHFMYVKNVCLEASRAQQQAADELHMSVAGCVPQGNLVGCTSAVKHVLLEAARHGALAVLLERSAARHQAWCEAAAAEFQKLVPQ
ncbi:hypothetical protein COO60DRAFT_1641828 [Scenedesmus sp. NREL 46B-D3]|nr:hypothetical protein COO60DRAFT_1641828 [Scenedesmus sp. NREL 46B-D3]